MGISNLYQIWPWPLSLSSELVVPCIRKFFCRLMPFGEADTTSQPPLGFCSAKYCIRFPCFLPHVCLPQVSVGTSPSRAHGLFHPRFFSPTSRHVEIRASAIPQRIVSFLVPKQNSSSRAVVTPLPSCPVLYSYPAPR